MALSNRAALVESPLGDLLISQGSDFVRSYRYSRRSGGVDTPVDLVGEGYTARAEIRGPDGSLWHEFTDIELTEDGLVNVRIDHEVTEAWPVDRVFQEGRWDLELVRPLVGDPNVDVTRFVMGVVRVSGEVTTGV